MMSLKIEVGGNFPEVTEFAEHTGVSQTLKSSVYSKMASASEVLRSDTTLAVCRLVEETKGHEMLKYLGPGCLVHFSDSCTPKILSSNSSGKTSISERASSYFLVASAEVLKKIQLEAFENKPNRSVKIVAEFARARDGRTLERKTLSPIREGELCRALDDIVESDGMIFIALSKLKRSIFSKSNLFSRALEVVEVQGENSSARMANDLQCILFTLVTSGKKAFRLQDNPVFGTKVYDLLQFDTVLTCEDPSRFPRYFLRNEEGKRFLAEDEFPKDEIAFGAIILQGVMFAGVLNFDNSDNRQPSPVFVGNRLEKAIQRRNERENERLVGAVGGIYPLLDPKSEERPKANDKTGIYDFPQPAASPSAQDQFVAGFKSSNGSNGAEDLQTIPCATDLAESGEKKENSGENITDEKASPIENSCRSEDLGKSLDRQRIVHVVSLEKKPSGEFSTPELGPETGTGGSGEEVQAGSGGQQGQGAEAKQEDQVAQGIQRNQEVSMAQQLKEASAVRQPQGPTPLQRNQENSVSQEYQVPAPTTMVSQGPLATIGIQRNPPRVLEAPVVAGGPSGGWEYPLPLLPERGHEAQGTSSDLGGHESGLLFQNGQNHELPVRDHDEGRWQQSLPSPRKEEHPEVKCFISVPTEGKKTHKLDDLLTKTLLGCLELLEAICRSLDKEYKYGQCKCWKHLAQHFRISEHEYQRFEYQPVFSPTELMFEYLQTADPDVTIRCLKDALEQIQRLDVISVLIQHEKCNPATLNDETQVSSLFDSDPDIIGEIAYLLDIQKSGVKNWSDLAPKLKISRKIFRKFENCNAGNPTQEMFELLKVHNPNLTIGELISHLEDLKRRDVIKAIEKSTKVTKKSVIKELVADVEIMEEVCDLLNQINRTTAVPGLRQLGNKLGVNSETLDDLLPSQEKNKSPTEALIRRLGGSDPNLTLLNLMWALHEISRPDVIVLLEEYLPDKCVSKLLISSCNCEICQQVLPRETGES